MRIKYLLSILFLALFCFAHAIAQDFEPEVGIASWYGDAFHGRKTACGEIFDMHAMTAAHKTLPFNTRVLVTNIDTGLAVVVRINDRGPFVKDRIIDLSKAAAECLGLHSVGSARVRIEPAPRGAVLGGYHSMHSNKLHYTDNGLSQDKTLRIQVASYASAENAHHAIKSLANLGFKPVIELSGSYHHVVIYVSEDERVEVESILDQAGWKNRLCKKVCK